MTGTFEKETLSKSVGFHPRVNFSYVPSRKSYTPRQIRSLWYGSSSILDIQARNAETLALLASGKFPDDDDDEEYCQRGLFTRRENRRRCTIVEASREAVFRAQEMQFQDSYVDDDEIALDYSKAAYASRLEARNQGVRDESDSPNYPILRRGSGVKPSRRRHSLVGCSSASPVRYQARRRISALGHL